MGLFNNHSDPLAQGIITIQQIAGRGLAHPLYGLFAGSHDTAAQASIAAQQTQASSIPADTEAECLKRLDFAHKKLIARIRRLYLWPHTYNLRTHWLRNIIFAL